MALSAAAKIGLLALGTLGAVGATAALAAEPMQKKKTKKKKGTTKPPPKTTEAQLSGVYAPGATIGATNIPGDVMLPVELTFLPDFRMPDTGEIVPFPSTVVEDADQLQSLVTDLMPEVAETAYELFLHLAANKGRDLLDPEVQNASIMEVLAVTAPKVNWSRGLQPYTEGTAEFDVWIGHQLLAEVAHQSYWNKQAAKGEPEPGVVVVDQGRIGTVLWRVVQTTDDVGTFYQAQIAQEPMPGFAPNWMTVGGVTMELSIAQATAQQQATAALG